MGVGTERALLTEHLSSYLTSIPGFFYKIPFEDVLAFLVPQSNFERYNHFIYN